MALLDGDGYGSRKSMKAKSDRSATRSSLEAQLAYTLLDTRMRLTSTSTRPSIGQSRAYLAPRSSLRVTAIASSDMKPGSMSSGQGKPWEPASWRNFPAQQQPEYPDPQAVKDTLSQLGAYPPLIFAGECRTLQSRLAKAATGEAFIVQVRPIHDM